MRTDAWTQRDALLAALILFAAVSLLILSGRQLLTELSRITANSYYSRYQPRFLSDAQGPVYVREATKRLQQIPPAQRGQHEWRRLAAVLTMRPVPDAEPEALAQHKEAIANALNQTLARNPIQVLGWSYLANLQLLPPGDCEKAMAALRQSFKISPIEPDFLAYRLELAARCPLEWDKALIDALRRDLLSLYLGRQNYARNRVFVTWLGDRPKIQTLVRRLLAKNTDTLTLFERDMQRFAQ